MPAMYNTAIGVFKKTGNLDIWKLINCLSKINKNCVAISWEDAYQ